MPSLLPPINQYSELTCIGRYPHKVNYKFETEFKAFNEFEDLPATNYAPAKISYKATISSISKYFNQPHTFHDTTGFLSQFIKEFNLDIRPEQLLELIFSKLDDIYPNIATYLHPISDDNVIDLLTHDLSGELRKDSSLGIGYKIKRKDFARKHRSWIIEFLKQLPMWPVFWKEFLKDELREIEKEARSIAVPQIHLWLVAMKILGGLYYYHRDTIHSNRTTHAFGIGTDTYSWTLLLKRFNEKLKVCCFDLKKQDSRMAHGLVMLIKSWINTLVPSSSACYVDYFFDESFTNKKVVSPDMNVYMFSDGEMSGNPLTIVLNTLHNNILFILTEIITDEIIPRRVLGDDSLFQCTQPYAYTQVAAFCGHLVYESYNDLYNDSLFLSWKFNKNGPFSEPYYGNVEKMIASLHYTKVDVNSYLEKVNSFRIMLAAAPPGSIEDYWFKRCDAFMITMLKDPRVDIDRFNYLPRSELLRIRRS